MPAVSEAAKRRRSASEQARRKEYVERRAAGQCPDCGAPNMPGSVWCEADRDRRRQNNRQLADYRRNEGCCTGCGSVDIVVRWIANRQRWVASSYCAACTKHKVAGIERSRQAVRMRDKQQA